MSVRFAADAEAPNKALHATSTSSLRSAAAAREIWR